MQFIEELVEYFAELITAEQRDEVGRLYGIRSLLTDVADDSGADDSDGGGDEYDEYDKYDEYDEYDFPAPARRRGHAGGRRHSLPRPAITAAELAAAFRKALREHWKRIPVSRKVFLGLARMHDRECAANRRGVSEWRRFAAAVESLKDLNEDELTKDIRLLKAERTPCRTDRPLLYDWAISICSGEFPRLANEFCRRRVDGVAGRAALAALREIAYPENTQNRINTKYFRLFLDNPDIIVIFDYYRVLRKLEYILRRMLEEAVRRVTEKGL